MCFPVSLSGQQSNVFGWQMREYHARLHNQPQLLDTAAPQCKERTWHDLANQYGLDDMMNVSRAQSAEGFEEEFESYADGPLTPPGTDLVVFWGVSTSLLLCFVHQHCFSFQMSEKIHPTLFAIALDYLPIQASAVPCERVFSSSAETDTKRRNRIHPVLMEALQMLKFSLKQQRLDFMEGWAVTEDELVDDVDDAADLLERLTSGIDGDNIDEVIHALGQDDDD